MIANIFALMLLGGIMAVAVKDDFIFTFITIAAVIVMVLLWSAELKLLGEGTFTADNDKVTFRIGFIKRTYGYSEINSTVTQIGFIHGKYGASPHVELTIKLKDGNIAVFRDSDIPDGALSTPEKHKEFHENHQFTKLSRYINDRAGK